MTSETQLNETYRVKLHHARLLAISGFMMGIALLLLSALAWLTDRAFSKQPLTFFSYLWVIGTIFSGLWLELVWHFRVSSDGVQGIHRVLPWASMRRPFRIWPWPCYMVMEKRGLNNVIIPGAWFIRDFDEFKTRLAGFAPVDNPLRQVYACDEGT